MARFVTLLQDCHVETRRHSDVLSDGFAQAGETIELLSGNGYHTVVRPAQAWEDEASLVAPDSTREQREAAEARFLRRLDEGIVAVYGPRYEGDTDDFPD